MTNKRLYLDVHAIQTLPPSNINRDDTGSPKTAQYGGVTRSRVSSQAWKRAIRKYFNKNGDVSNVGIRSLDIVKYLGDKILELKPDLSEEDALALAEKTLNAAKVSTKDGKAKALFFIGDKQARSLAQAAIDGVEDKKTLQKLLKDNPAIDIALFGRMVADDPSLNEDASCQVAHAISTHEIEREFDYYTAIDDLKKEDEQGAGMLGTIEFNSSTVYRYANIALHEFKDQLKDEEAMVNASKLFVDAFYQSMPTGKINTFANQTLPQFLLVTLRQDRPLNLVTAFEKPIRTKDGFVDKSVERLCEEVQNFEKVIEPAIFKTYFNLSSAPIQGEGFDEEESLKGLLESIAKNIKENI